MGDPEERRVVKKTSDSSGGKPPDSKGAGKPKEEEKEEKPQENGSGRNSRGQAVVLKKAPIHVKRGSLQGREEKDDDKIKETRQRKDKDEEKDDGGHWNDRTPSASESDGPAEKKGSKHKDKRHSRRSRHKDD